MAFDHASINLLTKSGADWFPEIVAWRPAKMLGRQVLVVEVNDDVNARWFANWVVKLELKESSPFSVEPLEQFRHRSLKLLTGFAKGCTGKVAKEEVLLLFLKASAKKKGVKSQLELVRVIPTPAGAVLHIEVDEEALEQLAGCNSELSVGFAGAVRFHEAQKKASVVNLEAEEELLTRKLANVRRSLEAKHEEESVLAIAGMKVSGQAGEEGDVEEVEKEGETEMEVADTAGAYPGKTAGTSVPAHVGCGEGGAAAAPGDAV